MLGPTFLIAMAGLIVAPQATTGTVSGKVSFADGSPAMRLLVSAIPVRPAAGAAPIAAGTRTSDTGSFRLQNLRPGAYRIRLSLGSGTFFYYPGASAESAATTVTVDAAAAM